MSTLTFWSSFILQNFIQGIITKTDFIPDHNTDNLKGKNNLQGPICEKLFYFK